MSAQADLERRASEFASRLFQLPPRKQVAAFEGLVVARDRLFGSPFENLRAYAERNDPWAFFRDVLGLEPTQQQDELLELFELKDANGRQVHRRILVHSGQDIGKTIIGSGHLVYRGFAVSQLPDPDGASDAPQGAIILLPGPGHPTVADTVWKDFLEMLDRAGENGYPLRTMFKRRPRATEPVSWIPSDELPIRFRSIAPAPSTKTKGRHSASGRHRSNMWCHIEEGSGVSEALWGKLDSGLKGPNNVIVAFLNPDEGEPSGPAFARYSGDEYLSVNLSALDFRNVVEREVVIPGGALTHWAMDDMIRHHCEDLGQREPEPAFHDFRYALPARDATEAGPREDGERGMEGCEVRTYRPDVVFVATGHGEFPIGYGSCPFDAASWDAAVDRWRLTARPDRLPDRWGVDPALEGADTAKAVPVWGEPIESLWPKVYGRQDEIPELLASGEIQPIYLGRPQSLGSGDGDAVAESARGVCGTDVPCITDEGGPGRSCYDAMRKNEGMNVCPAESGHPPTRLLLGEEVPENRRVQHYLRFARMVKWGLILIPPDHRLRRQAFAQQKDFDHEVYRKVAGMPKPVKVTRLKPKKKIMDAAGGSPDDIEAALYGCLRAGSGGWSLTTVEGE